jgi:hypothetical protein
MSDAEVKILRQFRQYRMGARAMLFFNAGLSRSHPRAFCQAMTALIRDGLVVKERPRDAYSLTPLGYRASLDA